MSQNIFRNPIVTSQPTLTPESTGDGTLTVNRLTHFTVAQKYTVICTETDPMTVFKVISELDGPVGVALVSEEFSDQDLKIFFQIEQGPTAFIIGDTFELEVGNGTDLNQENLDTYDEQPQKNFGQGIVGQNRGDHNLRYNEVTGLVAKRRFGDLVLESKLAGVDGHSISMELIQGNEMAYAYEIIQNLRWNAKLNGVAGNAITVTYRNTVPAERATQVIQDITFESDTIGALGNGTSIIYVGGGTAGLELVTVLGDQLTVVIEDGVSTAQEVFDAIGASAPALGLINQTLTGTPANPQTIQAETFLIGGSNAIGEAGNESVVVVGNDIEVTMQFGASIANDIKTAIEANVDATNMVDLVVIGDGSLAQTGPVTNQPLRDGVDAYANSGNEILSVDHRKISLAFIDDNMTAQQIKTMIEADVEANALVSVVLLGDGTELQKSGVSERKLRGYREGEFFSFNKKEISESDAFHEGNANILAEDVTVQGDLVNTGKAIMKGPLELDNQDGQSGGKIENAQKKLNNIEQNNKIFITTKNHEKNLWNGTEIEMGDDLILTFSDTGFTNVVADLALSVAINDGEHVYVALDRDNDGQALTPVVAAVLPKGENIYRIVSRLGDYLIWADNTLHKSGRKIRIGEGGSSAAYQEKLGNGNGVQTNFALTFFPVNAHSALVFSNAHSFKDTDWTYNLAQNQIEFLTAPDLGVEVYVFYLTEGDSLEVPSPDGVLQVLNRTISISEAMDKKLDLVIAPVEPSKIIVDIIGGGAALFNVDFTVSGTELIWGTYGLDGLLEFGDQLRIQYWS